jgi:hypothetical protein
MWIVSLTAKISRIQTPDRSGKPLLPLFKWAADMLSFHLGKLGKVFKKARRITKQVRLFLLRGGAIYKLQFIWGDLGKDSRKQEELQGKLV